jgi:hypothetical protein
MNPVRDVISVEKYYDYVKKIPLGMTYGLIVLISIAITISISSDS